MASENQSGAPTVAEMKKWYEQHKKHIENYAKAKESLRFRDISRSSNRNISNIDRESLALYFSNIGSNENNLREVARYLYYRSNIFYRIVNFYADMWDLRCRKVVPPYSLTKNNDEKKMLKSLNDTLDVLDRLNLHGTLVDPLINVYIEDVFFGIRFTDETGTFIYRLEPDECVIDGRYMTGDFSYSVDMSKWRSAQRQAIIEYLGEPLKSMWDEYQKSDSRYVRVPDEYCVCLKFRTDILDTAIPPFVTLFLQLANLESNIDQQAVVDEMNVFKLVYMPLKILSGASAPDEFEINPDLAMDYYKMLDASMPPYINTAIVPGDELKTVDFPDTVDKEVNRVESASNQILSTAGGGAVINSNNITSTAAFNAWLKEETEFAMSTLLPQINGLANRLISYEVSNPSKVEHFEVSIYTKEELRKAMLESCQYSFANRIAYNTLLGISERDTLAQLYLENSILELPELMKHPLSSSFTTSGQESEVGRPTVDDTELSGSGERSRNA